MKLLLIKLISTIVVLLSSTAFACNIRNPIGLVPFRKNRL